MGHFCEQEQGEDGASSKKKSKKAEKREKEKEKASNHRKTLQLHAKYSIGLGYSGSVGTPKKCHFK